MIYIVEIPHQLPPKVWSRSNKEQVMSVINEASFKSGDAIYEESTGRWLLEMFSYNTTAEMREDRDDLTALADLIDAHGLDTMYYKGYGDDEYGVEPVDEWVAHLEWNGHDLSTQLVYMTCKEARDALNHPWQFHQGVKAHLALEKELENNGE